jgi:hypothetical protein
MTGTSPQARPRPVGVASGPALVKITRPAVELGGLFPLSAEARALLDPALGPAEFIDLLCVAELHIDAIRFLAHALPVREAVWWACLAARGGLEDTAVEERQAVEAAEAWVYHPDEEHRRAAMTVAGAVANDSPARWAATAAAWSGGSLAPPEAPVVPPGPTLAAQAVAGAVLLAAVRSEPQRAPERHRSAIAQAIDIARGGTGRPTPASA